MDIIKSTAGGRPLLDALLKVHDQAPQSEKRSWLLLAKAAEELAVDQRDSDLVDLEPLAGALLDAAMRRLEGMVEAVRSSDAAMTRDAAERAVSATDVGSTLEEIVDMANRIVASAPGITKAVEDRLSAGGAQDALIERAKEVQAERSKLGALVSLTDALEIAKAERPELAKAAFR